MDAVGPKASVYCTQHSHYLFLDKGKDKLLQNFKNSIKNGTVPQ